MVVKTNWPYYRIICKGGKIKLFLNTEKNENESIDDIKET
jgi:hypothetical protein